MTAKIINRKAGSFPRLLKNYPKEIVLLSVFLLTYMPTLIWMWERWFARDSYYSHGILVPFVTGYLIWQKKDKLKKIPFERSPWAVVLIISGIIIHIFSSIFRIYFSSGFSMILTLTGLILYGYGKRCFREVLFPILFLTFMIPVPLVVIVNVSFKMKMMAAHLAAWVLNNARIPAVQEGSIIKMKHAYVVVDDVCSGLRSLISLTALGAIFAYWLKSRLLKRIIVFLTTIPIAIITNVFRIVLLSFVSEIWGSQYATGFIHDFSGFSVFALAFLFLFAVVKVLE